ncbi:MULTISPECIES: symmetrical bis(5'-nucleosyl)-tetraphosphatase [Eikenella]|uniref:bis(5'-nucleosyl)-tetraphosphatase (symmetrical) n=1 Tax=Eikenella longinqua TaxID=1795827 RepID=A0A1A9RXL0_9NEIS|nr:MULTISPECIES: symmetrical bis(5'-nucleosyl)-tetraphosphatase [Eikenella]OAM27166.1 bis(5'-nucleosyl)-tetraphosphatase (symmetrical) [Eikenella longinqua]
MAHYAIGDLQGCFDEFQELLAHIGFQHGRDTLWLVGDLVNRGPQSLACLRYVKQHEGSIQTVLGNHDLHLLAIAHGHGKLKRSDTVGDILAAPDRQALLDWLLRQPLMLHTERHILVHAGIWPQWDVRQAQQRASEVAAALQSRPDWFFAHMYGNMPDTDRADNETDRLRFATNVFTRMRALYRSGQMEFDYKGTLPDMPAHLMPWFRAPNRQTLSRQTIFGHWSALGLYQGENVAGIDTGALWGNRLTALDLSSQQIFQVASKQPKQFE